MKSTFYTEEREKIVNLFCCIVEKLRILRKLLFFVQQGSVVHDSRKVKLFSRLACARKRQICPKVFYIGWI